MSSIAFVTNNYTPYQGGVVSSIKVCAQELRRLGHEVTIITLDFDGAIKEDHVIRVFCPLKFTYKTNQMAWPLYAQKELFAHFKRLKPDIVHVHHPFLLGKSAYNVSKILTIPCVFTYHTFYHYYLHYLPFPELLTKPLVNHLVASFCNDVDGIVAPSNAAHDYLKKLKVKCPISVIPTAILPQFFEPQPQKKTAHDYFNLISVSRFAQEKNITQLLDLMSMLDEQRYILTLVGYGPEYKKLCHYAYEVKKLSPLNVRFVERPSKDDLVKIYGQADLFIFASLSETQGLVVAEAMAQGTPVVAFDGPGQRDVIINDANGYLVNDVSEMKEKIALIAHSKLLQETLRTNAQRTALNYHPEHLVAKLLEFYYQFC